MICSALEPIELTCEFFTQLLNFIIAIIVDNYAKVVESVQDFEAEQEFFTDLTSVVNVSFKALWLQWPSKRDLVDQLSKSAVVNVRYGTLRVLFPTWSRQGIRSFLHHYSRYEFMSPTREKDNAISHALAGWILKSHPSLMFNPTLTVGILALFLRDCATDCGRGRGEVGCAVGRASPHGWREGAGR